MPGGIVPEQHPRLHACRLPVVAAPLQNRRGDGTHGSTVDEAPPDALVLSGLAQQHPLAGHRLRVGLARGTRVLDQPQRSLGGVSPRVQVRTGAPTPPRLIGEAEHPVRVLLRHSDQAQRSGTAIRRSRRPFCGRIPERGC
jgi:hypothetical protein